MISFSFLRGKIPFNMPMQYLKPWARLGKAKAGSQDLTQATELWEWLEEQVKDV
jgi:hypothetical protein